MYGRSRRVLGLSALMSLVLVSCESGDQKSPVADVAVPTPAPTAKAETSKPALVADEDEGVAKEAIAAKDGPAGLPKEGKVNLTEAEWKERLTPEQFYVCRKKGTERAFTGKYWDSKTKGTYACVACGHELFSSDTKFDSGTGWPSFWQPASKESVRTEEDRSFFSIRTEVLCARCDSHLGHVFDDGPAPTHLRYCINSVSLDLKEKGTAKGAEP